MDSPLNGLPLDQGCTKPSRERTIRQEEAAEGMIRVE
jgi:hypothetical protein